MAPATRPGCDVEFLSLRGSQAFFLHQSILVGGLEHVLFSISYGVNQSTEVDPGIWRFAKALYFWGSFKRPDTQPGASSKREKTQAFRQIPTDPYRSLQIPTILIQWVWREGLHGLRNRKRRVSFPANFPWRSFRCRLWC